ncbi:MAG TPA: HIT domain-containing protein [Planctomycetaceae bacterium]|nr:HIT domain-containing protein [Planctomycetaceae bacterium]
MSYERLWAPWRLPYIKSDRDDGDAPAGCFLCRYRDEDHDDVNHVVARGPFSLVVLNRFPYNNGHLLIAPRAHKGTLEELADEELLDTMHQVRRMIALLGRVLTPEGFNVGLNLGRVAGAGLPGHLHWHVVPRWNGDTNFMPVVGETKVISQSLDALFEILRDELEPPG